MQTVYHFWARLGGLMALLILIYLFISGEPILHGAGIFWIHLSLLLIHQFEEYVFPGGFKHFFNSRIYAKIPLMASPLTDQASFIVNVVVGWSAYLTSAILQTDALYLGLGLIAITITNGLMHTWLAIKYRSYNPGFYSAIFLLIPFGLYFLFRLQTDFDKNIWAGGILVLLIGLVLIPAVIYLSRLVSR